MRVKLRDIKVPNERARKEFDDIDKLAVSIQEFGLLQPLLLDKELNLIAGERRYKACSLLELDEVEVVFTDEVEEWRKRAMELEENIQRKDLTFAEECEAKLRLHELYQEKHGKTRGSINLPDGVTKGWGVDETAELLGDSIGETVQDLALARAIRENPKLAEKETKSAAYKAMRANEELDLRKKIAQVLADDSPKEERIKIMLGDARQILRRFEDESFDFCVTDPPYGVGIDESHDLGKVWDVRVSDTKGEFGMQTEVFREVYRVLRSGAHCYVFFATMMQYETITMLKECGFWVSPIPLIWVKSGATNYDPYHLYTASYEPIFYCSKGSPRAFNTLRPNNIFNVSTPYNKVHPTEKPVDLIKFFVDICSVENEIGIDPFAGSGTFGVACRQLNRRCVMIELDEGYYVEAYKRVGGEEDEPISQDKDQDSL